MFSLLLAVLSSALVSIVMRLSTNKINHNLGMLTVNYFVCALLSRVFGGPLPDAGALQGTVLLMGLVNGGLYLAGFMLMQRNIRLSGVVLSSIFQKLGLLVTVVISVFVYHEIPGLSQCAGFLLALGAIVLMNYRKESRGHSGFRTGLLWMLLACGMADAMSKVFAELGVPQLESSFLFLTFASAMVLCLVILLLKGQRVGFSEAFYGVLIAVPNFFSSKFLLAALNTVPGVIVYPAASVGTILVITLTGVLLFRERLQKTQWTALALILLSLILLNI